MAMAYNLVMLNATINKANAKITHQKCIEQ
jgi:hypothetical protein